jgi:hypothetical protein
MMKRSLSFWINVLIADFQIADPTVKKSCHLPKGAFPSAQNKISRAGSRLENVGSGQARALYSGLGLLWAWGLV